MYCVNCLYWHPKFAPPSHAERKSCVIDGEYLKGKCRVKMSIFSLLWLWNLRAKTKRMVCFILRLDLYLLSIKKNKVAGKAYPRALGKKRMNEEEEDFCGRLFNYMKTQFIGQEKLWYMFTTVNLQYNNKNMYFGCRLDSNYK